MKPYKVKSKESTREKLAASGLLMTFDDAVEKQDRTKAVDVLIKLGMFEYEAKVFAERELVKAASKDPIRDLLEMEIDTEGSPDRKVAWLVEAALEAHNTLDLSDLVVDAAPTPRDVEKITCILDVSTWVAEDNGGALYDNYKRWLEGSLKDRIWIALHVEAYPYRSYFMMKRKLTDLARKFSTFAPRCEELLDSYSRKLCKLDQGNSMDLVQVRCWRFDVVVECGPGCVFVTHPEAHLGHELWMCRNCGEVYALDVGAELYPNAFPQIDYEHLECLSCRTNLPKALTKYPDTYMDALGGLHSWSVSREIPPDEHSEVYEFIGLPMGFRMP